MSTNYEALRPTTPSNGNTNVANDQNVHSRPTSAVSDQSQYEMTEQSSGLNLASADAQRRFFGAGAPGEGLRGSLAVSEATSGTSTPVFEPYRDLPASPISGGGRGSMDIGAAAGTPFLGFGGARGLGGNASAGDSADAFNKEDVAAAEAAAGKRDRVLESYVSGSGSKAARKKRMLLIAGGAIALIVIGVAVGLGVALSHKGGSSSPAKSSGTPGGGGNSTSGGGDDGGPGEGNTPSSAPITGGDGSIITTDSGVNFTYSNKFGGFWVADPDDPFNNNAQAQSWVPPLNQTWDWNKNRAWGVNLGGWLVLEPFITPQYFEKYKGTVDEWTLSIAIDKDPNSGGLQSVLENHYNTFITEQDFAEIAGAGLSWVRIPFPFWAIEIRNDEPFLEAVSWKYFLKAIEWARKYGIRINLDLHTMPGSQNGYNHSGRLGLINFLNGVMGIANAQRGLEYIRVITEFISQPQYSHIALWGFMNEAVLRTIGKDILSHFYLETHDMIRNITGVGAGHGPYIAFHDGFQGTSSWAGYMRGADRLVLDSHPYLCFVDQDTSPITAQTKKPCNAWGASFNSSLENYGVTVAGEWALSFTDCGKWLNGVGMGTRWEGTFPGYTGPTGGSCDEWTEWQNYSATTKKAIYQFAQASMDALPHWFFWTWKIANSTVTGKVESPMWSYQLGLQQGWIPLDPRSSIGTCGDANPFEGPLAPSATGGKGAGTIAPTFVASFNAWPPASLSGVDNIAYAPTYTATGTPVPTLPPPTYTMRNGSTISGGDGWFNKNDIAGAPVNISGCTYPDAWAQTIIPQPSTSCGGNGQRRRAPVPMQTAAPLS